MRTRTRTKHYFYAFENIGTLVAHNRSVQVVAEGKQKKVNSVRANYGKLPMNSRKPSLPFFVPSEALKNGMRNRHLKSQAKTRCANHERNAAVAV